MADRRCQQCNCVLRSGNPTRYCAAHQPTDGKALMAAMQARAREVLGTAYGARPGAGNPNWKKVS